MTFKVEVDQPSDDLAQQLGDAVREVTKLRAAIEWAAPHSLPNDGKVIEDARSYR
jgi:phenylacetate-CoA ligase